MSRRRIFRNPNRPRSNIDVRVGSHLLEILCQLRREDYSWYLENEKELEYELLEMLEERIVPRMFGNEIEEYHKQRNRHLFPADPKDDLGFKHNNSRKKPAATKANNKSKKPRKMTAAQKRKLEKQQQQEQGFEKPEKDVYFSFGELIQIAYRRESLFSKGFTNQRTLLFKEKDGELDFPPKLPYRLLLWISKVDKANPDQAGVGFYRPELIPISSLFREPKRDLSDSEDE